MNGRIEYIDIAKALAIFLVVYGHTVGFETLSKAVVYSFHMPLFFVLSGMLLKPSPVAALMRKKAGVILWPYLLWGLIYCSFSFGNMLFVFYGSWEMLIRAGSLSSLWFLPVLYLASLFATVYLRWSTAVVPSAVGIPVLFCAGMLIPHLSCGYPFGFDVAVVAAGFLLTGRLCKMAIDRLSGYGPRLWLALSLLCAAVFVGLCMLDDREDGYVRMANAQYLNRFLFVARALAGSLEVLCVSVAASSLRVGKKICLDIGRNTLGIFIVHKPVIGLVEAALLQLGTGKNELTDVVVSVASLVISYWLVRLLTRYLPFMFRLG